jgi:K+-sensing histidine kinase KdpD
MDSEYKALIKVVSSQNDNLVKSISEIEDKRTMDNQIVNYKNEQTSWFNNMNKILLVLYYFLALIFMYQIMQKKTSSNKYITVFLLLVFPFVFDKIELLLYNTMKYIWTFLMCVEYPYQRLQQPHL